MEPNLVMPSSGHSGVCLPFLRQTVFSCPVKKALLLVLASVALLVVGFMAYWQYRYVTSVDHYLTQHLGIRNYTLLQKVQDNHQWYAKVALGPGEGARLLHRYPFAKGYDPGAPVRAVKPANDFINACAECRSYLNVTDQGVYGYVLYRLNENQQQLELYNQFGD